MATDTARLRALLEAATPPPWKGDRYDGTIKYSVLGGDKGQYYVFSINHSPGEDFDANVFNYGDEDETLMLEAVNALPGLIAETERLRAALEKCRDISDHNGISNKCPDHIKESLNAIGDTAREALNANAKG